MTTISKEFKSAQPKQLPEGVTQPYIGITENPDANIVQKFIGKAVGDPEIVKNIYRLSTGTEVGFVGKMVLVRDTLSNDPRQSKSDLGDISMGPASYAICFNLHTGALDQIYSAVDSVITTPFNKLDQTFGIGLDLKEILEIAEHRGLKNLPPLPGPEAAQSRVLEPAFDR